MYIHDWIIHPIYHILPSSARTVVQTPCLPTPNISKENALPQCVDRAVVEPPAVGCHLYGPTHTECPLLSPQSDQFHGGRPLVKRNLREGAPRSNAAHAETIARLHARTYHS